MLIAVALFVWPGEPIRVSYIEREELVGSRIEPGAFGTEGESLASELSRQMGITILILVYNVFLWKEEVISLQSGPP